MVYLSEDRDAALTRKAVEKEGRRCVVIAGDVRQRTFCKKAVAKARAAFGHVDILVNNAAFQLHSKRLEDITDEHFDMTVKTNVYGYFFMTRAVIPHLPYGGAIINTGSITGIRGGARCYLIIDFRHDSLSF